jgi:uncharacterized membrane protein
VKTTLRIELGNGLVPMLLLVFLLLLVIYLIPSDLFRLILSFPFVLFFPGYALSVALIPAKENVSVLLRVAISIGLSISVVVVLGLLLNFSVWGITLESLLGVITIFLIICTGIAWRRQKKLAETERFTIDYSLVLSWPKWNAWERGISIAMVLFILGACGTATYVLANPNPGQEFTEFYLLNNMGMARDLPRDFILGQASEINLGIVNHEHTVNDYRVMVSLDSVTIAEISGISLDNDAKWEGIFRFTPAVPGLDQVLEFHLYKNGKADTTMIPLRLHINVREQS